MSKFRFCILVPTYNESLDIARTLDAALLVEWPNIDILVVDDSSTDNTIEIVRKYTDKGVRLIEMKQNRGVASARNVGIQSTEADVVIVLNADVILPPEFIMSVASHYDAGADFVVVESIVANLDSVYGRYVQACHTLNYRSNPVQGNYDWSEGWSCRREVALAVGGFPEEFPGASGEDAIFVMRLIGAGYRRVYDPTIEVSHFVPHTLRDFWKQRLGRGKGIAFRRFGYEKVEPKLFPMLRAWLGWFIWQFSIIIPFWRAVRLAKVSSIGVQDLIGMYYCLIIDSLGHQMGYWKGYRQFSQPKKVI